MKRTHTILTAITLISVILTSACTAGNANSTTSSVPETTVTTTVPAVTGTVIDRIDEPKAETTTAQTTATLFRILAYISPVHLFLSFYQVWNIRRYRYSCSL